MSTDREVECRVVRVSWYHDGTTWRLRSDTKDYTFLLIAMWTLARDAAQLNAFYSACHRSETQSEMRELFGDEFSCLTVLGADENLGMTSIVEIFFDMSDSPIFYMKSGDAASVASSLALLGASMEEGSIEIKTLRVSDEEIASWPDDED